MKQKLLVLLTILCLLYPNYTNAIKIKIITKAEALKLEREVSRTEIFNHFWEILNDKVPKSFKYIDLDFFDVKEDTLLYESLQRLVYLDMIRNWDFSINSERKMNLYTFYKLSWKVYWLDFLSWKTKKDFLDKNTTFSDLWDIKKIADADINNFQFKSDNSSLLNKKAIFSDVYSTIMSQHYDKDDFDKEKIIYWAIEWLAKWTDDKFTTYFPPTESKEFYDSLNWEFEWIWSYVDMEKPWEVKIVSPISWSPSDKAWLKGWDIIIKVDQKEISEDNSLKEVVSWIKWPAWTKVTLTIRRWSTTFDVEVTREKILIKDIEFKSINRNTFYLEMKSFWDNTWVDFRNALDALKEEKNVNKIIIDLRNNWWGYLDQVVDMLSFFIEKDETTAVVKYKWDSIVYKSKWYDVVDFTKYEIIILQNSWTASASEILIWTLNDYYPELVVIWEKSYWKWSVQSVRSYHDWSSLKFTIAKWFTWKTETWIDWIWISPDIELEFDIERYQSKDFDNQLDKAIRY